MINILKTIFIILVSVTSSSVFSSTYKFTALGTLGGHESTAYSINDIGQIVGYSYTADNERHAFLYDNNKGIQDLGTLGGNLSIAYDINNNGQVTGFSATNGGNGWRAFRYDAGNGMQNLGILEPTGTDRSQAYAINDSGHVVGKSGTGFIYDDKNGMQYISPTDRIVNAKDINKAGQIVGQAFQGRVSGTAFIYDEINGIKKLRQP